MRERVQQRKPVAGAGALRAACALVLLSGCSFNSAKPSVRLNACSSDADCSPGSHCQGGLCAMDSTAAFAISLEVVPARAASNAQALAIPLGPFNLTDATRRSFELPRPVTMFGYLHDGKTPVGANVSLTAIDAATGTPTAAPIQASTVDPAAPDEGAFGVQLLDGVEYRVVVQPMDVSRPPHTFQLTAKDQGKIDLDYAKLKWTPAKFVIHGAPSGLSLMVRQLDKLSGEALSNSAPLSAGAVTLLSDPGIKDWKLEITAEPSQTSSDATKSNCDTTTPVFPVLTANDADLGHDAQGNATLSLPAIPEPIRYSGTVELCTSQSAQGLGRMSMTLDATAVRFADTTVPVTASYKASTTANVDVSSGALRFCTRVLPGDYVVVVTPPANLHCDIFAQRRTIATQNGADLTDEVLSFQKSAVLSGTIETTDQTPVSNASIDAVALGRDLVLAADDPSVASYNRSRQTTSNAEGAFELPVDVGSYDVVIKPPAESNFAWQVLNDVNVAARRSVFATRVQVAAPVLMQGTLKYVGGDSAAQHSLAGADVHAYTRVGEGAQARNLEIGRCVADAAAGFTLLLPPSLHKGW
ncbi:MAG TPA: hypothetical protein VF331_04620 [Polyangiales bacterium]